jgi:hypothetical protein
MNTHEQRVLQAHVIVVGTLTRHVEQFLQLLWWLGRLSSMQKEKDTDDSACSTTKD